MENAGINIAVEAIAYIRGVRLDLNRNLTDAFFFFSLFAINR
jgi:hypothetical protein